MGTDAGMFGHGDNAAEIVTMVEAGMTPMQALVATTATAARCIGLGDDVGTIEPGKIADLILLAGDPLQDITLVRDRANLRLVMKDGVAHVNQLTAAAPVAV